MINLDCGECPYLCNDEHSSGCGAPFPIDHCEVFNKAMEEESKRRENTMITKEEYEKTVIRMMDSVRESNNYIGELNCKGVDCIDCPIGDACKIASRLEAAYPIVEIVEKWGKEHPVVTNADKYREIFGVNPVGSETNDFVCPSRVGFNYDCKSNCTACKITFWTSEYKAPKKENE